MPYLQRLACHNITHGQENRICSLLKQVGYSWAPKLMVKLTFLRVTKDEIFSISLHENSNGKIIKITFSIGQVDQRLQLPST